MAWTTPADWTNGQLVTHTVMNQQIKDNMAFLSTHTHSGAAGDGSSALADVDTVTFDHQGSDPSAPSAGHGTIYFKSDGLYFRNTGGSATRLALSSDVLTVGQVVESTASGLSQNYGDGDTAEETVVTLDITAGGAGRYYVITAGACTRASTASTVNATFKLYYDTTVLETVNDTDLQAGDVQVLSQTQSNPATSSKTIKLTCQIASGGSHITMGTLSVREIYTA
jgi:hypothetical protein